MVVSIEMIAIAASAYIAFIAYSAAVYGVVFFHSDYVVASLAAAALYVALCIADNQYDLLGPQWNEQSRSRGSAALALSFIMGTVCSWIGRNEPAATVDSDLLGPAGTMGGRLHTLRCPEPRRR